MAHPKTKPSSYLACWPWAEYTPEVINKKRVLAVAGWLAGWLAGHACGALAGCMLQNWVHVCHACNPSGGGMQNNAEYVSGHVSHAAGASFLHFPTI